MAEPSLPPYNVGDLAGATKRQAPAAVRNVGPIGDVLADWLPDAGTILEVASGTGEHALAFARRFPSLVWQPSDPDPLALHSITAWSEGGPTNLLPPLALDASAPDWPVERADAVLNINMVHIAPWPAALGLLDGASRLLPPGGRLVLYGPWIDEEVETAPSNLAFDADLKSRNPEWGLRRVGAFTHAAKARQFTLADRRAMPSNNLMLLFVNQPGAAREDISGEHP
jgi:SAM-dependent methyltransferase